MAAPFADFAIPPLLHLGFLLAGSAVLTAVLYAVQPPLTQRTVLAMVPWVVTGAILHVFHQVGEILNTAIYPAWAEPLFAAPAVYLTTFIGMGTTWLVATAIGVQSSVVTRDRVASYLAGAGLGVMLPILVLYGYTATDPVFHPLEIVLPVAGLLVSLALAFVVYIALGAWRTYILAEARHVGGLVIFAHTFDGVTTAIGYDLLGATERSTLPRLILEFARDLPTNELIGAGWLFVAVKVVLAVVIVALFADYISDRPRRGTLLFAVIAVVGLGPALNNFFLFLLSP
jgi:uncharacterized membrane protein